MQKSAFSAPSIAGLCLLAIVVVAVRAYTYNEPFERDIMIYSTVADQMLHGRMLYAGAWDHKPPAVFVTLALSQLIFGQTPASIFFLNAVSALLTMFAIHAVVLRATGDLRFALLGAAFWAIIGADLRLQANQPNVEAFMNAARIWALALFMGGDSERLSKRKIVVTGILFALGTLYKQVEFVWAAALSIAYVIMGFKEFKQRLAGVLLMAIPGVCAWLAVFAYFKLAGTFDAFYDAVFVFNSYYSGQDRPFHNLLQGLKPSNLGPRYLAVFSPLILLSLFGLVEGIRRRSPAWLFLLCGFIATWIEVSLPGRFFAHYYQLYLPLLAIGGVLALHSFHCHFERWTPQLAGGAIALLIAFQVPCYLLSPDEWSRRKYGEHNIQVRELGLGLKEHLRPGETFYQWGADPGLYFYSEARPSTFLNFTYPIWEGVLAPKYNRQLLAELESDPPELFILGDHLPWPPVRDWFMGHYVPYDGLKAPAAFRLYALRGSRFDGA